MSRNFPDFIEAYCEYAADEFCHPDFHRWSAISVIAAALERKVWAEQPIGDLIVKHYPNLFVMLLAVPGDGKTTAAERAIDILKEVKSSAGEIAFLPPKVSDAQLYVAMGQTRKFIIGNVEYEQTPAFYYAAEASNALKEIKGGDEVFPTMTEAYDCKDKMHKGTRKYGDEMIIKPCMSVLACSTFNHLKAMLTEGGIMGGFASRFVYVVGDEKMIRKGTWGEEIDPAVRGRRELKFRALVEDLQDMYITTGTFVTSQAWRDAFSAWFPTNDAARYAKATEKEQSFYARKHVAVIKLAMIFSVAENALTEDGQLLLDIRHWEKALSAVELTEKKHHKVIGVTHSPDTQEGINAIIREVIGAGISERGFKRMINSRSLDPKNTKAALNFMLEEACTLERFNFGGGEVGYRPARDTKLHVIRSADGADDDEEAAVSGSLPDSVKEDLSRS